MPAQRVSRQITRVTSNEPAVEIVQSGTGAGLAVTGSATISGGATVGGDPVATHTHVLNEMTRVRQFAATGSVLTNTPSRPHPGELIARRAVGWWDAAHSSASAQTVRNLGWGGSALDAQAGSTAGVDANDPVVAEYAGETYVRLPGVTTNYISTPDAASLDIVGDLTVEVDVALPDWTPASAVQIGSKWLSTGNQRGWYIGVTSTGAVRLSWTTDGASGTQIVKDSTANLSALAAGARIKIRASLDIDNGAGGYDVAFQTSDDGGATWSALGTTVTTAGSTSIYANTALAIFGGLDNFTGGEMDAYRMIVSSGVGTAAVPVLDIDTALATPSASTFGALTGQTVTINRSTGGLKSMVVQAPGWLFGTAKVFIIPDSDLLDMGADQNFTVVAAYRRWHSGTGRTLFTKKADLLVGTAGYSLSAYSSQVGGADFLVSDGTTQANAYTPSNTAGELVIAAAMRDGAQAKVYTNGAQSGGFATVACTTGSLANTGEALVGRVGAGSNYLDAETFSVLIFREALSSGDLTALTNWLTARIGG